MSNPGVWENTETTWENPNKKKKKGIGSIIEKILDAGAHKKEKKKDEKGEEESQVKAEESHEVPHEIATYFGSQLLIPVQQALQQERLKASLPKAASMAQHLTTETELKAEDDPSLKGKNFDLEKPQSINDKNLSGPIEKARAKEEELSKAEKEKEKEEGFTPLNFTDVLHDTLPEAREQGERMGTTSPQSEQKKKEEPKPTKKGKSKTPPGRSSKEEPTKSRTSKKESTKSVKTGPEIQGQVAADFLKSNVNEARKLGEKMGTTSPKSASEGKTSEKITGSAAIQGKVAADFLKSNVNEARKLGEKMGTTSPKSASESYRKKASSTHPSESNEHIRGAMAAEFLRSNITAARKLGEKKGTTSPRTVVSKPPSSMEDFTSGFKEVSIHEPKTGIDILRETVSKARELGEKMGTTSPSESYRFYKEDSKLSQRE